MRDIWTNQGGTGSSTSPWDHSRIVSYVPTAVGDPAIPAQLDNHFCAYSVPGNDNGTYGLTWDGKRIWFGKSGTGAASSFDLSQLPCGSMLDYSQASRAAASA